MKTTQINFGSPLSGSTVSVHHAAGLTVAEAHAAAKLIPGVKITETFRQAGGTISSFGYLVES